MQSQITHKSSFDESSRKSDFAEFAAEGGFAWLRPASHSDLFINQSSLTKTYEGYTEDTSPLYHINMR